MYMRCVKRIIINIWISSLLCLTLQAQPTGDELKEISKTLRKSILTKAAWALRQSPVTVTANRAQRSAGGLHDFFSEGDYWWPDPANPDGAYIQRDGMTNPENFVAHRQAMIRFSEIVGSLAAAYKITGRKKYAEKALEHCDAWLMDTATRMTPHLLYAQAIKGRVTGRGIGIIDAIHLMEVVKGLEVIEKRMPRMSVKRRQAYRQWFAQYLQWVTTHAYGLDEMKAANNHGTCWVMQVAVFAGYTGNDSLRAMCSQRFKEVLLPSQMAADGSFPLELKRTKPYGYSLFNLDAMATICQELSNTHDNLWQFTLPDGRSMEKAIQFLYPWVVNKSAWPYAKDVMYWEQWPVAHPFLVFGGLALQQKTWLQTWTRLEHAPTVEEVIRNLPVRNPLLWIDEKKSYE